MNKQPTTVFRFRNATRCHGPSRTGISATRDSDAHEVALFIFILCRGTAVCVGMWDLGTRKFLRKLGG